MFTVDHDDVMEFGLVEEGEYEVQLIKVFEDTTPNGADFINLQFVIRNDIEQKHQNQWLFHKIWKSKKDGQYVSSFINAVARGLKVENGKRYNSLDEMLNDFKGRLTRVKVSHSEYNNKTYANIDSFTQTTLTQCNHKWKEKNPLLDDVMGDLQQVSNNDVPF